MGTAAYPTPSRGYKLNVSFGLVNVGVKYAPLVPGAAGRLKGKKLDPVSNGPVFQQYVNEKGAEVKPVTGYPHGDSFVVLDPEDVKALESERDARFEPKAFMDAERVDALYFEKAYLVWPDKGHETGYDLLCTTLARTGKVLVGTTIISKSTKIVVMRYRDTIEGGTLLAHVCAYDADVAWSDNRLVALGRQERPEPDEAMVDVALKLFSGLDEEFDFSNVVDEYDARLRAAVEAAAAGLPIEKAPDQEPAVVHDLMEALKASVAELGEKPAPKKPRAKKVAA